MPSKVPKTTRHVKPRPASTGLAGRCVDWGHSVLGILAYHGERRLKASFSICPACFMTSESKIIAFKERVRDELRVLATINPSDRTWQMPFAGALATGLPLLIGAYFDRMAYGLVATLGGLVFLYLPPTPMHHRMAVVMAASFAMTACYALGLISQFSALLLMPMLVFIAILVTMICRFYMIGPPGSLFFVMAAAIGAYTPNGLATLPTLVGLLAMGCLLACLIAFFYSLYALRLRPPQRIPRLRRASFDFVVLDSIVIGVFVGISLVLAQAFQLEKAYWVPVSCLAVIQGVTLRAVWNKQLHRIVGTCIGLLVSWGLLHLPMNHWSLCLTMMVLSFIIEMSVVRHYAVAAVFITPLTILLAEAATLTHGTQSALVLARFYDTLLGCAVGLAGAVCLHSPYCRAALNRGLRMLVPGRFDT